MDAKPAGLDGEGRLQALLKLAQVGAEYNHHRCLTVDEPHQEHTYPFHACQHPDCVLVRSVPAAPPRSEQFQRVLQEMEGSAGQYGLGETLAVALHSWVRQLESLAVVPAAPPPQEGFCDCRLLPPTFCALCHRQKQPTVAPPPQEPPTYPKM